ncbi:hypothetical protein HYS91_04395 [Candidatus Daviesbacteria bacterium]|nr:hypothetical protein [Candidatus Daviesbacteria bacterium]
MLVKKSWILYLPFLTLGILIFQSTLPLWFGHISTDTYVYYNRASYFFNNLNLADFEGNEHLPGAIIYFILATPAFFFKSTWESYVWGFITVNSIATLIIDFFIAKIAGLKNILFLSLILLSVGPISLFRFDLLVVLLTIISFYFFIKEKNLKSAFFLGSATLVKIYPVIFLPYLLYLIYKKQNILETLKFFSTYILSLVGLLWLYVLFFQVSMENILFSLTFHTLKPVHTESLWTTILTIYSYLVNNTYPEIVSAWGINGLAEKYWLLPLWFYNYAWVLPVGLFYIWLLKNRKKFENFDIRIPILIVLLFLIFSKVLSHQYLLWFLLLIPLLNYKRLMSRAWIVNIFLILLTNLLHQYIYPLNYTQFLNDYYNHNVLSSYLFWLNALSNLILVIIFWRIFREIKIKDD